MKLTVAILTYNQQEYIRQALDSVLIQEVNFDYEIVVGDDCSSDNTPSILHEYAERFPNKFNLVLNQQNVGISKNYQYVLYACRGEYIALLEGDDYWTDKNKLQKSVDFLDSHPDYGFVGAYNTILNANGCQKDDAYDYFSPAETEGDWQLYGNVFDYAKCGPVTRTVTICFRKSIILPYVQYVGVGNDMVLQCVLAHNSKFAKCKEVWGVYRQGGVSTNNTDYEKKVYYVKWYVANRLLQKKLFPAECNWNEDELADMVTYVYLKNAIVHARIQDALQYHCAIKSKTYQNKFYYKFSRNAVLCLIANMVTKFSVLK